MQPFEPLERRRFDAAALVADYPPRLSDANKRIVYAIACPRGGVHSGSIDYSRWPSIDLPAAIPWTHSLALECRPGFFDYRPTSGTGIAMEWHINFADPHLFAAYGSRLFAQDEMQVAEHPALGSLREALVVGGCSPMTVVGGEATPILVSGVERRCRVATDANALEGRPGGLYGNAFGVASADTVRRATRPIEPPTVTHLIAMAAPWGGSGAYSAAQIHQVLVTAFSGFTAAHIETRRTRGPEAATIVHAGFWGCGAFGGNRVLMAMLQVLAARMARLDRLVFHAGSAAGAGVFNTALESIQRLQVEAGRCPSAELVERIRALGFQWGQSDGN